MQVVLVMFRGDGERRSFSVVRDETIVGRREDCDLRIPVGDVSRKHCRILIEDQVVRIEDLGSSNGTLRNGIRVQSAILKPGDRIKIGPVTFVVQIDGVPGDDEIDLSNSSVSNAKMSDDDLDALLREDSGEMDALPERGIPEDRPSATTAGETDNGIVIGGGRPSISARPDSRARAPSSSGAAEPDFEFKVEEDAPEEPEDDLVDFDVDGPARPTQPDPNS